MTTILIPAAVNTAIDTYDDLVAAVALWLNRTDLNSTIPQFILLAEAKLNADLRNMRGAEATTTLATTADTRTVTLPTDLTEIKRLQIESSYNTVLQYLAPDQFNADYSDNKTGLPLVFTVVGSTLELAPIPDAVYSLGLTYFQRLTGLSSANQTNWLLTTWPNAYLWATLLAAQPFLMNDPRIAVFQSLYDDAINGINGVDWWSGSTPRVKAR